MNVPRYDNFILSQFKSLERNKTLLCRDPLFISSVEVDCKQSFSSFINISLCEERPQEDRSASDEWRSLESRVKKRGPVDLHNLYISDRA